VRSLLVYLAEDVEEERVGVEVQRLVVEEQLGEEAEVLAVDLVVLAVDLEDGQRALAVDLLAGRLTQRALALRDAITRSYQFQVF
jgi:hypothetical protein